MYCRKCGAEINDEAVVCIKCGCSVESKPLETDEQRTGIGFLMGLFLGIIGLIIGFCLFKSGTSERNTFVRGWLISFILTIATCLVLLLLIYYQFTSILNF